MSSFQDYKLALQTFQSRRLRRDYADLADEEQYKQIGEFFFEEMYGPRDFSARDEQAHRLKQFVHIVPGVGVRDVEPSLQLLDLTNKLDDSVTVWLMTLDAPLDFDEAVYERAYRLADNYDERVLQLELVSAALYNVYRLGRKPLLGTVLQGMQGLALATGMADIHRFLLLGYQAIQPVRDIYRFVETLCLRERDRLDRIYEV